MITNLVATIIISTSTNWSTVAVTRPVIPEGDQLWPYGNQLVIEHQVGTVFKDEYAIVEIREGKHKGKRVKVKLASTPIKKLNREKSHKLSEEWNVDL